MKKLSLLKKIIISGPESTGKTEICRKLSLHYNTVFIPEYARSYIENLKKKYTYKDVEHIAKQQIELLQKDYTNHKENFIFFDTGLIITKIWFQEVYGKFPKFIENELKSIKIDAYLLCYPDIEWLPDKVRENGGEKRIILFNKYLEEIKKTTLKYFIIKGEGDARFQNAVRYLDSAYCL